MRNMVGIGSGAEFWSARELARVLEYTDFRNFVAVIAKAREACAQSGHAIADHFVDINEMVSLGSGAQRAVEDWALSRYACYLVIQNADPSKPLVALGQSYFAVQTRRQELADDEALKENKTRLVLRAEMTKHNKNLAGFAKQPVRVFGVVHRVWKSKIGWHASATRCLWFAIRERHFPVRGHVPFALRGPVPSRRPCRAHLPLPLP
ncbi:MAG: hypothetical protein MUF81_21400 [Verrucomicrobia bacterium]|nr:hypothetical protein [Verrucomicrobiota bacterium]